MHGAVRPHHDQDAQENHEKDTLGDAHDPCEEGPHAVNEFHHFGFFLTVRMASRLRLAGLWQIAEGSYRSLVPVDLGQGLLSLVALGLRHAHRGTVEDDIHLAQDSDLTSRHASPEFLPGAWLVRLVSLLHEQCLTGLHLEKGFVGVEGNHRRPLNPPSRYQPYTKHTNRYCERSAATSTTKNYLCKSCFTMLIMTEIKS